MDSLTDMPLDSRYALARLFCIRAAGVSFDRLVAVGTPAVSSAARAVLAAEREVDRYGAQANEYAIASFGKDRRAQRKTIQKLVKNRQPISDGQITAHPALASYAHAEREYAHTREDLDRAFDTGAHQAHVEVRRQAVAALPDFALIESAAMLAELALVSADSERNAVTTSDDRHTDRSLAMYLQRVCAKNDTISRFGPSAWGFVVDGLDGLRLRPAADITKRCLEIERWVVTGAIEALNHDPATAAEVCPRVHPDAMLDALALEDRAVIDRCDGLTSAYEIGDLDRLARLRDAGLVIWRLEQFAVDSTPLASLIADLASWRDTDSRKRWLPALERVRQLALELGEARTLADKQRVFATTRGMLVELGIAERARGRTLYAAANPISENCYRPDTIEVGAVQIERLVAEASPWFDLFHDAYALGVARAFVRYRELAISAPRRGSWLSYTDLVDHAHSRALSIENDQLLFDIGSETFEDVKQAFGETLQHRDDAEEWELTEADCHVLRRRYELPHVTEFAHPQADLQLAARSPDEVAAGRYRWVVAELHHGFVPLQHATYWSCPDKPVLHAAIAATLGSRPYAVREALTELPVHVAGEAVFAAVPNPTFVGAGRPKPGWKTVRRADAEVVIDDKATDIRLRDRRSGDDLGSIIRGFRLINGMHPFFPFERAPHAARLRVASTIVQRQTWHVRSAELGDPRPIGVSSAFVLAIEKLRRDRGVPRWVFVRVVSREKDFGSRDKDLKPLCIDLESCVYLDIFERRLRKYGQLLVMEMLPAPEELPWTEPGSETGRVTFELRTSVVPR